MKITLTPTGTTTPFVLADDTVGVVPAGPQLSVGCGGQCKEGIIVKQKRQVQKSPLFRSAYALNIPRYNLENRFSFTVQRSFTTPEDCSEFVHHHADNVPTQGEVLVQNTTSTGETQDYLPNAVVESVEFTNRKDVSCDCVYTLCGNGPWQTSP